VSIYGTLWTLKFPRYGDDHTGCEWIEVIAQGVPAHIGSPEPGHGYESGDPYAAFLPPATEATEGSLRAVVFITPNSSKGTRRSAQEYDAPLLVLSGAEYERLSFAELHDKLCTALRGDRPRTIGEVLTPDGGIGILFEDGSSVVVPRASPSE
jgi:hypothetical protein